jgi:UDP-glucuronate 4-epimerase
MARTFLITGALGCIGAWAAYHLLRQGERVVSFDIGEDIHRLDLLLTPEERAAIVFVQGDLSNPEQVLDAFQAHDVSDVIHLGALQVPYCKADPIAGAQVNVVGTVNVFEAARQTGVKHVAYASSIAVYGPPDEYPPGLIVHEASFAPRTLYGVYKAANEGMARVYWYDYQISSTTLRAYTVYGLGRDRGLTREPTEAMLAAAAGQPYHISFGGHMQMQWASDVALQFIEAARNPLGGAYGFNLGGAVVDMPTVIDLIRQVKPDAQITCADVKLPFPDGFDDSALCAHFEQVHQVPLAEGVRQTIRQFEQRLADGRLTFPPG